MLLHGSQTTEESAVSPPFRFPEREHEANQEMGEEARNGLPDDFPRRKEGLVEQRRLRPARQDGWTEEDDRMLAEVTLRHIAEGSTQTRAFEEAGDLLNRTSGACAFRWATVVKHDYQSSIEQAKRKSRELKKRRLGSRSYSHGHANRSLLNQEIEFDLELIVRTLKTLKQREKAYHNISGEVDRLESEVQNLREENQKLRQNLQELKQRSKQQEEDYKMLLQIVNRARKVSVRDDVEQEIPSIR